MKLLDMLGFNKAKPWELKVNRVLCWLMPILFALGCVATVLLLVLLAHDEALAGAAGKPPDPDDMTVWQSVLVFAAAWIGLIGCCAVLPCAVSERQVRWGMAAIGLAAMLCLPTRLWSLGVALASALPFGAFTLWDKGKGAQAPEPQADQRWGDS